MRPQRATWPAGATFRLTVRYTGAQRVRWFKASSVYGYTSLAAWLAECADVVSARVNHREKQRAAQMEAEEQARRGEA